MKIIYLTACAIVIFVMQGLCQNFTLPSNTLNQKGTDKYPTLESYMLVIIDFYKVEANKSDSMFDIKE